MFQETLLQTSQRSETKSRARSLTRRTSPVCWTRVPSAWRRGCVWTAAARANALSPATSATWALGLHVPLNLCCSTSLKPCRSTSWSTAMKPTRYLKINSLQLHFKSYPVLNVNFSSCVSVSVRLYRRPWWVFYGVLLKVMLLMTGADATPAPLARMDSRPAPLFRNLREQFIALISSKFQSQNTDLDETLGHKWSVLDLYSRQAQAIAFVRAQQLFGHHRMESRRATNRSEDCWLPHQSGEGDGADGSLKSGDRYI